MVDLADARSGYGAGGSVATPDSGRPRGEPEHDLRRMVGRPWPSYAALVETAGTGTGASWRAGDHRLEVDAGVAVAFAVVAEVELALSGANILAGSAAYPLDAVLVLLPLVPLVWQRVRPFAAVTGMAAMFALGALLGGSILFFGGFFPLLVAIYWCSAIAQPPWDRLVLLVPVLLIAPMPWWLSNFEAPYDYFLPAVTVLLAWGAGRVTRRWQHQSARLAAALAEVELARAAETRLSVALERARIARELHDVVAHSLSIVVLQASAARLDATGPAADTLATVERTGREALAEMRRLLGVLRDDDVPELAPQPGLDGLPSLLGGLRAAGLQVELTTTGERRPLPEAEDVTAYRIVAEALTNALKHGADRRAGLLVAYEAGQVRLRVVNAVAAPVVVSGLGAGQGLIGIRERVALFGGRCDNGPDGAGHFVTEVVLPTATVAETPA